MSRWQHSKARFSGRVPTVFRAESKSFLSRIRREGGRQVDYIALYLPAWASRLCLVNHSGEDGGGYVILNGA
jgi:hypothetical protein